MDESKDHESKMEDTEPLLPSGIGLTIPDVQAFVLAGLLVKSSIGSRTTGRRTMTSRLKNKALACRVS